MAQSHPLSEHSSPTTILSARTTRHDGWTTEKQVSFLRVLATTQSVKAAAASVGMGRQSAYKLRARLDDGPFGAAWRMAMRGGKEALLEAALERAIHGVEVPHFWKGELIGTSRRYDERLTALLLGSGLLQGQRPQRSFAEEEFAEQDLARLLERIESGPPKWCNSRDEYRFAVGESSVIEDIHNQDCQSGARAEDQAEKGD